MTYTCTWPRARLTSRSRHVYKVGSAHLLFYKKLIKILLIYTSLINHTCIRSIISSPISSHISSHISSPISSPISTSSTSTLWSKCYFLVYILVSFKKTSVFGIPTSVYNSIRRLKALVSKLPLNRLNSLIRSSLYSV